MRLELALPLLLPLAASAAAPIATSRGVLSWDEKGGVYRDGTLLGHYSSAPGDAAVIENLARLAAVGASSAAGRGFSVCFEPPRLRVPDPDVLERVRGYGPLLRRQLKAGRFDNAAWVEAIITHESGADPKAISPTGCAGLAAVCQSRKAGPHCCVKDAADDYRTIYDLCNSESVSGYHCDPATDARFDPAFSLRHVIEDLKGVDARVRRLQKAGASLVPELAVPMAYNAGFRAFPEFPKRSTSSAEIMSQLDLSRGPYRSWDPVSKANKAVEIYDYLQWFPFLANYYRTGAKTPPVPPSALLCFHDGARARFEAYPAGSLGELLIRAAFDPLEVRRLSFGKYRKEPALQLPGSWRN